MKIIDATTPSFENLYSTYFVIQPQSSIIVRVTTFMSDSICVYYIGPMTAGVVKLSTAIDAFSRLILYLSTTDVVDMLYRIEG